MVDRIYLSAADRETMEAVLGRGLGGRSDLWRPARLALARSLQMTEEPTAEAYPLLSQQGRAGVELHSQQFTGEGKGEEDQTEIYRALLSAYHGRDLTDDEDAFHDLLQRHVRRGLKHFRDNWTQETDFADFLLRELFGEEPGAVPAEGEGAEFVPRIERILGQLGIGGIVVETVDGPRLTRYTIELRALDDLDRLKRGLAKIAFALGYGEAAVTQSLAPGVQRVYLHVPRPVETWRVITWREVSEALAGDDVRGMALPVCPGTDAMGVALVLDLAEAPHLFVGGTTGSGKSMCLHAILLSLLMATDTPPELALIDPKAVEFSAYGKSKHLWGGAIVTGADDALALLNSLVDEMEARQERMRALDARNIDEANAVGARLRRIVVVIDELGDLFMTRREIEVPLIRLAQKARSSGIHLVLATQRPEAATFPGLLRSNIPSRIALTVQKAAESRIILDEQGAESLQGRGDMLVRFAGRPTVRAHGCRIDPADILGAVEST